MTHMAVLVLGSKHSFRWRRQNYVGETAGAQRHPAQREFVSSADPVEEKWR